MISGALCVFVVISMGALIKKNKKAEQEQVIAVNEETAMPEEVFEIEEEFAPQTSQVLVPIVDEELEDVDRIQELFSIGQTKSPIVETVSYKSRVEWLKGRPAWIADYASFYSTSRHFIARSLNRKADYYTQKVSSGDRFNVFKKDKNINFHLVVDLSRCKMLFYYHDIDEDERLLLKTYSIGLGRFDNRTSSGSLTPTGKYLLGEKVGIYKPGSLGLFQDEETELIQVFGTRWIPFGEEVSQCSEGARGFGIHGAPWEYDEDKDEVIENRETVGKYESDGCIRLLREDMEELFSIVITKPTYVEVVRDYHEANLPGKERE